MDFEANVHSDVRGLYEGRILAGYYVFNADTSFTAFQAVKNLYAHPKYLRFGLFCKCFGDIWAYLGIKSFSQRIRKICGNWKFWRFDVVLKSEF